MEHLDVLIVGAGLSGIGAAWYLQDRHPDRSYAIVEARNTLGGTWDLFRYPGIRSDSDMQTLGYRFRPWTGEKAIADGPSILSYVTATAQEAGIDQHIRYGRRVVAASWSTRDARWTVTLRHGDGAEEQVTCHVLQVCSGYYRYDEGFTPDFAGTDDFAGTLVHPQHWPEDLDVTDRRVVVIGSGATAVTLVPALAEEGAEHVTMLQRTPTYILSLPSRDAISDALRRWLPERLAYRLTRWKNVAMSTVIFQLSQRAPSLVRRLIRKAQVAALPDDFDVDTHLDPPYQPWDQRMCLIPDGDLWQVITEGRADIVTDHVDTFTTDGVRLRSGGHLDADVVVTATGLNLLPFGGIDLTVDGAAIDISETVAYKGMMLSGVPNYVFTIGYTNASWTLKADLVAAYLGRVLAHLDEQGHDHFVPVADADLERVPLFDFDAGYVKRSLDLLPDAGATRPWKLGMSYSADVLTLRHGSLEDGALQFRTGATATDEDRGRRARVG